MKILGPLSSITSGSRLLFVSLEPQLDTNENISSINSISSDLSTLNLSSSGILSSGVVTKDGTFLEANKTIYFRASASNSEDIITIINIGYTTSLNNQDTAAIRLRVVPRIL